MKRSSRTLAVALLVATLAAGSLASRAVDDPPPERDDCPLCGGNPMLHVRRMFAIEAVGGRVLSAALRW